jgi:thioredoxin-like negative regulator of GroEL
MKSCSTPLCRCSWNSGQDGAGRASPLLPKSRTAADMEGKATGFKVDTEKYPQVAGCFQVSSIPHFVVLSVGRTVMPQAGLVEHTQMERWQKSAAVVSA